MEQKNRPTVRMYQAGDQVPLQALIQRTIDICYCGHYCAEAVRFFKGYHSEQAIRRDADEGCTVVLDRAGRILGTGTLVGDEVKRVFVDPACQRQGLGRLIMHHLEERAGASGIDRIRLDASLPSKAFYDRLGYATIEATSMEVENGRRLDFFRMRKIL